MKNGTIRNAVFGLIANLGSFAQASNVWCTISAQGDTPQVYDKVLSGFAVQSSEELDKSHQASYIENDRAYVLSIRQNGNLNFAIVDGFSKINFEKPESSRLIAAGNTKEADGFILLIDNPKRVISCLKKDSAPLSAQ